jgi:hypothetical protein
MDKETYDALKRLVMSLRQAEADGETEFDDDSDLRQLEAWMDEVAKDYL